MMRHWMMSIGIALAMGCGTPDKSVEGGGLDARSADAPIGDAIGAVGLPTWMLEDVQPASPRVGQTYGLDGFNQKIIVVSLLEGF